MLEFKPAVQYKRPAKVIIQGVWNAGKTHAALAVARGLCNYTGQSGQNGPRMAGAIGDRASAKRPVSDETKIALVDTEFGRSSFFARRAAFSAVHLSEFSPTAMDDVVNAAIKGGFEVLIIDSLSSFWSGPGGILSIANSKLTGWKTATPAQDKIIKILLDAPIHVICTVRVKIGYTQTVENGRPVVQRVGMEVVQRDEVPSLFDWVLDIDTEHNARFLKAPPEGLADQELGKVDEGVGEKIAEFLNQGDILPDGEKGVSEQEAIPELQ